MKFRQALLLSVFACVAYEVCSLDAYTKPVRRLKSSKSDKSSKESKSSSKSYKSTKDSKSASGVKIYSAKSDKSTKSLSVKSQADPSLSAQQIVFTRKPTHAPKSALKVVNTHAPIDPSIAALDADDTESSKSGKGSKSKSSKSKSSSKSMKSTKSSKNTDEDTIVSMKSSKSKSSKSDTTDVDRTVSTPAPTSSPSSFPSSAPVKTTTRVRVTDSPTFAPVTSPPTASPIASPTASPVASVTTAAPVESTADEGTSMPTASPIDSSVGKNLQDENCKVSSEGLFGTSSSAQIVIPYFYKMEHKDAADPEEITSKLENYLSDEVVGTSGIFKGCSGSDSNADSSTGNIVGLSSLPEDRINNPDCGDNCVVVEGRMTFYLKGSSLSRRLGNSDLEIIEAKTAIEGAFQNEDNLKSASSDILKITYLQPNDESIINMDEEETGVGLGGSDGDGTASARGGMNTPGIIVLSSAIVALTGGLLAFCRSRTLSDADGRSSVFDSSAEVFPGPNTLPAAPTCDDIDEIPPAPTHDEEQGAVEVSLDEKELEIIYEDSRSIPDMEKDSLNSESSDEESI